METNERLASLEAKMEDVKKTLSNGVEHTLSKIWDKVNEMSIVVIDNSYWVGKWKQGIFWTSIIAVAGGLIALAFRLIETIGL